MKILVEKDTPVWVNGKKIIVKAGTQDVDEDIARILIHAGYARAIKEKPEEKKETQPKKKGS